MPAAHESASAKALAPMLASVGSAIPDGAGWTFEPKYDGIRVLAFASPTRVELRTRNGIDKAPQFPEIVAALATLVREKRSAVVLDGEIVARDGDGLGRFQGLQERLHQRDASIIARHVGDSPALMVGLDLLALGKRSLVSEPWDERRRELERLLRTTSKRAGSSLLLGETHPNDGAALMRRARREHWEGIVAKRTDAPYASGKRSPHWMKLKIEGRQELVVGGWTEPRNTRQHIGALLLGYYDDEGDFIYAGHTGGGFTRVGLEEMYALLAPLERKRCPFTETPRTNERAHWTRPQIVVEVKFNEWTDEGRLRQPIFLGVRDDKDPRDVRREIPQSRASAVRQAASNGAGSTHAKSNGTSAKSNGTSAESNRTSVVRKKARANGPTAKDGSKRVRQASIPLPRAGVLGKRIGAIEASGGDGTLAVAPRRTLELSSLDKAFFPKSGHTKGDLLAFYATVAPAILPLIEGRPLVLKRYPDGIGGQPFYQQNAPSQVPEGVRTARVEVDEKDASLRLIGGDLSTLLYCVQLGCVEVHPWHSRIRSLDDADYSIIDLDPGPRATFGRVVNVARWLHEVMEELGIHGALKTSGSSGLHIYLPLPVGVSYETSRLVAELIATRVATQHPKEATVIRSVRARAPGAVYVDYLQNVQGKSVAAPFSVRPVEPGQVSTPLEWSELTDDLDPGAFTMATVMKEWKERRALWSTSMRQRNTLRTLLRLESKR